MRRAFENCFLNRKEILGLWPDDPLFREFWIRQPQYGTLNSSRLVHLYGRLNQTFMSSLSENLTFNETPTVEHIMPQSWQENWPLSDGSKGLDLFERIEAEETDPRANASRKRDEVVHTIGNMTLLSASLNSAQSNLGWEEKRPEIAKHSLLPINQTILSSAVWNEGTIFRRGEELFDRAVKIWGR